MVDTFFSHYIAVNADYVLVPIRYSGNSISCANISIIDDDIEFEANEYFTLTIQGPSMFYTIGSISTLTVTIIDNDGKTLDCMYYSFEVGGLIFVSGFKCSLYESILMNGQFLLP